MIARLWHGAVPRPKADAYDDAFLVEREPTVTHYEVLAAP